MEIDKELVIQELSISAVGSKGFYTSRKVECPECGKADKKFAIKFIGDGGLCNCFVCGYTDSIFGYLFKTKQQHLILKHHNHDYESGIEFNGFMQNDNYDRSSGLKDVPEVNLPHGFKTLKTDLYLSSRGITPKQIERYGIGKCDSFLSKNLRGYYLFQIINNDRLVGWLARTSHSKEWHDDNKQKSKMGKVTFIPRYRNSGSTEFQDVLGNLDTITDDVKTVFVVEGITDMFNVENILPDGLDDVGVVFTFGHSFGDYQRILLKNKNVDTVILMYDSDSIKHMKKISFELMDEFETVLVAQLPTGLDPGDINGEQLATILRKLKDPVDYFSSTTNIN